MVTAVVKKLQIESPHEPPSVVKHAKGRGYLDTVKSFATPVGSGEDWWDSAYIYIYINT